MSRTLLELSRSYAAGQLDFQAYRQQQGRLIRQQLQAIDDVTQPGAEVMGEAVVDKTRDYTPTRAVSLSASGKHRKRLLGGALAVVMILLATLVALLSGGPESPAVKAPLAIPSDNLLQRQLAELLHQPEPTMDQLNQLGAAWQTGTAAERQQTRTDPRYRQFLQQLDGQVMVLEALDPEGRDPSVSANISQLKRLHAELTQP